MPDWTVRYGTGPVLTLLLRERAATVVQAVIDPDRAGAPDVPEGLQHHVPDAVGALAQAPTHGTRASEYLQR